MRQLSCTDLSLEEIREKKLHKLVSKSRACHDNRATARKLVEADNLSQVTINWER